MKSPPRARLRLTTLCGRALRRGLVAVAILVASLGPADVARAADDELLGALKRVEKVSIVGNEAIGAGDLRKVLKTGDRDFLGLRGLPLFRPDFLRADVTALQTYYRRHGFLDAVATAAADSGSRPDRVVVTFQVVEGALVLVRSVTIDSTTLFTRKELLSIVRVEAGRPFDPVQVPLDRGLLANRYAERGHFPSIETTVEQDGDRVDIRFIIIDGPPYHVGRVTVAGVARVDTTAVVRELLLEPDDLYRRDRLVESTERLSGSGLFTSVEIEPARPDTSGAQVDLHVSVRERKPRWLEGGVGTGTDEIVRLGGQWGHRNLSGDGKTLTATGTFGWNGGQKVRSRAELAFVEPWLLRTRTRGRVAVSAAREFDEYAAGTYIQEGYGLSFGLARDYFAADSRLTLTFDNTWTTMTKIIDQAPGDTSRFFLAPYLPRLTIAFDQDHRDQPLLPTKGALNHLSAQLAGDPKAEAGWYAKLEASTGRHFPVGNGSTIALGLRAGIIRPIGHGPGGPEGTLARVPVTDRYRVGGTSNVRGYHENGIDGGGDDGGGGILLSVVNLEYRRRVRGAVGLTFFVDGGNVWRDPSHVRLAGFFTPTGVDHTYGLDDMHWAGGVGVHLVTPIGPLRLDYAHRFAADESDLLAGRALERDGFHFAIGFMF